MVHTFARSVATGTSATCIFFAAVIVVYTGICVYVHIVVSSGNLGQRTRVDLLVQFLRLIKIFFCTLRVIDELHAETGNLNR